MYGCEHCNKTFDSPIEQYEHDTGYYSATCPYCGSDQIEDLFNCVLCGEPTDGDFCGDCIENFVDNVVLPIRDSVGKPEDVLASFWEGYPKDGKLCVYCDGGNCESCKDTVSAVIASACKTMSCTEKDIEEMASQYWGW